ncbi:MAG: hypothetical protein IMF17_01325 [Proteobacteria bacterium]|nr:hypothetical protein [Pseudomonadota bacterium]
MKLQTTIITLALNFFAISTVSATSLLPISLEQLSTRASLIFYGTVVSNEVRKDDTNKRIATFTTFKIAELIKGDAGSTHTIKQIGGIHAESKTRLLIHGVPEFQTGKDYVVFLPEKSALGFSSPLGLHQGQFSVTNINDETIVSNGRNLNQPAATQSSRSIQVPLAVRADNPSQARLQDFINTVRAYNIK